MKTWIQIEVPTKQIKLFIYLCFNFHLIQFFIFRLHIYISCDCYCVTWVCSRNFYQYMDRRWKCVVPIKCCNSFERIKRKERKKKFCLKIASTQNFVVILLYEKRDSTQKYRYYLVCLIVYWELDWKTDYSLPWEWMLSD